MGFFSDIVSSVAGPFVGGALGLVGNAKTNEAHSSAASAANSFTKQQLQNRHQWEVEDLRKAGLNPILSAGGTPSIGSSAKADVESSGEAFSRAASSALDAKRVKAEIDLLAQQRRESMSREALNDTQNFNVDAQTAGIKSDNVLKALDAAIYGSSAGEILRGGEKLFGAASSGVGSAKNVRDMFRPDNPGFKLPRKKR